MTSSKNKKAATENLDVDELSSSNLSVENDIVEEDVSELSDSEVQKELNKYSEKKLQIFEIYKIIVDTRKFEIDNFWKRTVFFWGAIGVLLLAYFTAKNSEDYLIFIAYLGFSFNFIFSLSLRGSKYWQEHWETAAEKYESGLEFKLFRWKLGKTIKDNNKEVLPLLRPYRYSVSKLTMILSDITLPIWLLLIIKDWNYLFKNSYLNFQFSLKNDFDFFTFSVILIPVINIVYLIMFFRSDKKDKS